MLPAANIMHLGQHICDQINATPGNNTTITIQEETFFWIPHGMAVWLDIIGYNVALRALIREERQYLPWLLQIA